MRVEIFTRDNELIAIPANQIKSIRWFEDRLILYIESARMHHSFTFESADEGFARFDEIVENINNL